jgi:hypothetical protein
MMELTVIRTDDRRRMVVAVEAGSEAEALRAIQNAVGPVILDAEEVVVRRRRSGPPDRHARTSSHF